MFTIFFHRRDCLKNIANIKDMLAKTASVVKIKNFPFRLALVKFGAIKIAATQPADKFINKSDSALATAGFSSTNLGY